jgi:hypothetical protein
MMSNYQAVAVKRTCIWITFQNKSKNSIIKLSRMIKMMSRMSKMSKTIRPSLHKW